MTLGILGGLGPASTAYFYEMLLSLTEAAADKDHIDMVISSRASTPDRTAYILGKSEADPAPVMVADAKRLEAFGAELLAIPCNTAHYFYDIIQENVHIPVLNIIEETVQKVKGRGGRCIGLLATEGTVKAQAYHLYAHKAGVECITPNDKDQADIMQVIYGEIKGGKTPNVARVREIADRLFAAGADHIVLGCTELSLLTRSEHFDERFVDSMLALAETALLRCGKIPKRRDAHALV